MIILKIIIALTILWLYFKPNVDIDSDEDELHSCILWYNWNGSRKYVKIW